MARRKRQFLEDDDSDSSPVSDVDEPTFDDNDPDARAERELFENPYKRKRRRKNAKEDAIYGVFASDDDEEDEKVMRRKTRTRAKAPAFVSSSSKATLDEDVPMKDGANPEEENSGDEEVDEEEGENASGSEPSKSASPRVREEEDEEEETRPRFGGLGLGAGKAGIGSSGAGKGGIGSSKAGLGTSSAMPTFSKGGIGSSRSAAEPPTSAPVSSSPSPAPVAAEDFPTAFGGARTQRSFIRNANTSTSSTRSGTPLPAAERAHFSKLSGTFGARMLEKMGWQAGQGLGTTGEGIVTPVESKLRPKGMGIAFKGFKEKTEQSKAEARRRGEIVSDDEAESKASARKARKAAQVHQARTDAWKKPKKTKTRVEHKTYEEIISEAGQDVPQASVGPIIDATGTTMREVSSLADVSMASWTPTTDPMRLPEIRHNLRLITESCRTDLDGLAREARALEERKKWIRAEDARLRKQVDEEAELIARMQQMNLVVDEINTQSRESASMYEASLEPFAVGFDKLLGQYGKEFDRYRLDEVIVAAIAPVVRRMLTQWQPLEDPTAFTASFRAWRRALKMASPEEKKHDQVQVYGSSTVVSASVVQDKPMTPYESLLWNSWLPRVRSSLNNDWSPEDPLPAVRLYEAWSPFLPPFIRDNFFDQLVLPKVHKAVGDWNPRKSKIPLQTLVFPWLPHVGLRLEEVLGDARRKVKSVLRSWTTAEAIPQDLGVWKDVFDVGDWDTMILKYVVPKLGSRLREDFRVNPRQQDMQPLQDVMSWEELLRPTILSQILEKEFFPKWLDVLHIWLIQPNPSFEEVSRWYSFWKGTFSENMQNMPGIAQGFTRGLQLMNKALELGPDAPTRLPRPDYTVPLSAGSAPVQAPKAKEKVRPVRAQEITFRSIVEEYAASHNLLFIPTGKVHEQSRMPLYRVSPSADGKGGVLVYILDDAVWAPDSNGDYRAIPLEDMVLRATK
ncbi:TFP11-domain-containing protein [Lentinus tigrinus ALCF2SS1-7]|uniref:TFP11-domain-containing protein n=1 Tax=Lentinus tigrinus ALCF2SS1-6 TaxID=1328759 RepID=A0A5C2RPA3_9APHY|nr:TFP11-domain-containing protein [Lentinus tigrinus ALCF2SS1-6]RPD68592.1 TFP11-domain-containing protein [Lentinus tigrinus ALCF2SS1-7]